MSQSDYVESRLLPSRLASFTTSLLVPGEWELVEPVRRAKYSAVASEYYNEALHPTSSAFRRGSVMALQRILPKSRLTEGVVLEVGAGRSILRELNVTLDKRIVTDSSIEMLEYSAQHARADALVVADAERLPVRSGAVSLLVASLGDPYNTRQFWYEVSRVLAPRGVVAWTSPSHTWAARFRDPSARMEAVFSVGGDALSVPSLISHPEEQTALWKETGLRPLDSAVVTARESAGGAPAPKLADVLEPHMPAIVGYLLGTAGVT